jgi:type IV pilus assembly protein PilC
MEITIPGLGGKVTTKDVVIFTRQLTTMIDAGLPLAQCLDILAQQTENKVLAKAVLQIKADIESGATFADGLKKHSKIFDDLYTNMVAAGEVGGILDTVLGRLAGYMEKAAKLKAKIKGAMIYPVSIVTIAVVVTGILLVYVIPVFADLFTSFGEALPAPTQFVVNLSNFTLAYFQYLLGTIIALIFAFRQIRRTEKGEYWIDYLTLRLPVFGDLVKKASVARFTRTLSALVSSGVPILEALSVTARTAGNKVVEKEVFQSRVSISEGKALAEPLRQGMVFPPMVCQMISVGETTGALDTMLEKVAAFYEDEVDDAVANLTAFMEPMVIAFLGVVIGGLVISMYLPIFKLGAIAG